MHLKSFIFRISAHTIEDPVLRRLRAESLEKNAADAADEERKQLLLRIATVGVRCVFFLPFRLRGFLENAHLLSPADIHHTRFYRGKR